MSPSRQLKFVGRTAVALGAVLALAGVAVGVYAWTHLNGGGDALGVGIVGGVIVLWLLGTLVSGAILAGLGWALLRGWWAAAVVAGALTSLEGTYAVAAAVAGLMPAWASATTVLLGAYFIALGLAVRIERHVAPSEPGGTIGLRLDAILARPLAGTLIVAAVVSAGGWVLGVVGRRTGETIAATRQKAQSDQDTAAREAQAKARAEYQACSTTDRLDGYCESAYAVAISTDGGRLGVVSYTINQTSEGTISMWDRVSGRRVWQTRIQGQVVDSFQSLAFSPDGRYVVHTLRGTGILLSASDGAIVRPIEPCRDMGAPATAPGPAPDLSVAFSRDVRRMAVGGSGICIVDTRTGTLIRRLEAQRMWCAYAPARLTFSHDGGRLYAVCHGSEVVAWDVDSGKVVVELSAPPPDPARAELPPRSPVALYITPDESAVTTFDASARIVHWNLKSRAQAGVVRVAIEGGVGMPPGRRVVFTADGRKAILAAKGLWVVDTDSGQDRAMFDSQTFLAVDVSDASDVVAVAQPSDPPTKPKVVVVAGKDLP